MPVEVDDFNRADESPAAFPWVADPVAVGQIDLSANRLTKSGSSGDAMFYFSGGGFGNDQYSEFELVTKPSNNDWGPAVQVGGGLGQCGYWASCFGGEPNNKESLKMVNSSVFSLGSSPSSQSTTSGDLIKCQGALNGSSYEIKWIKNGTTIDTHTDASLSGGDPGVFWFETGGALDNWEGGDVGGTPGPSYPVVVVDYSNFPIPKLRR